MAEKPSPVACAECEQLLKDYADASVKRVRAYGNLKLSNLRSDSETMEMLAESRSAGQSKARRGEKENSGTRRHPAHLPKTYPPGQLIGDESVGLTEGPDGLPKREDFGMILMICLQQCL
jgi:hypothetical protein